MLLEKRGQISYFILVGILLLIAAVGFLFLRGEEAKEPLLFEQEQVDQDILPISTFMKSCIDRYAVEGIHLLGAQGGYITLPPELALNPSAHISTTQHGNLKVPLWFNNGQENMPTLSEMETQLATYVQENMHFCLDDFKQFEDTLAIEKPTADQVITKVEIGEEGVNVFYTYPLTATVKGEGEVKNLENFGTSVQVQLKKIYDLAKRVMVEEHRQMFFENLTINLMTLDSGEPPDGIPFSDVIFQCGKVEWSKPLVVNNIKNLLFYNLPRVTVGNTDSPGFPADDVFVQNNFLWDVIHEDEDDEYEELGVGFYYSPTWATEMVINPSNGNKLEASYGRGAFQYLKFACINAYHFTYTLTYPIMTNIIDESAFSDKGFVFSFGFPVYIDHNEGNREDFTLSHFERPTSAEDYCRKKQGERIALYAKDKKTGEDILDAEIKFTCMGVFDCPLGKTHHDGGVGRLSTLLPAFCHPGSVEVTHPDYAKIRQSLNQEVRDAGSVDIPLIKLNHLPFSFLKRKLINNELQVEPMNLEQGEYVVMFLTTEDIPEYDVMREYPQLHGYVGDVEQVDNLFGDLSKVSLAEDDITYDLTLILLNDEDKPIGGLTQKWTPTQSDVEQAEEIVFTVIEKIRHPTTSVEQAQMMVQLQDEQIVGGVEHEFVIG